MTEIIIALVIAFYSFMLYLEYREEENAHMTTYNKLLGDGDVQHLIDELKKVQEELKNGSLYKR